ncbi:MAG: hypothetical protein K0U40_02485 [Betaproteobacteria bacterium]|nr:hypothetical protein [Betaproteobacteria bacterium]
MKNTNLRIQSALKYIRDNPGCDTNHGNLDVDIVESLYNEGVIEATYANGNGTNTPSREYTDIRLNVAGKLYLSSFKELKPASGKPVPRWYKNPFLVVSLGVTGFFIGEYIISYFGLK